MDEGLMIRSQAPKLDIPSTTSENVKKALKTFFAGETGRFGNFVATKNALVYRCVSTVDGYNEEVICLRLIQDGRVHYLANSSRFQFVGSRVAFGNRRAGWRENEIQQVLERSGIAMLPFIAFQQADLKLTEAEILEQTGGETVRRITGHDRKDQPIYNDLHFTGSSLFRIGSKYFLFDIDRAEIQHGIFNPFIVELPKAVNSVKEAYASLVPEEVKEAALKGIAVKRQGEHFFIKVSEVSQYKATKRDGADRWNEAEDSESAYMSARLEAQGNRAHVASRFYQKLGFVSGIVVHRGREHANLDLNDGWYKPVPNTAVRSFTIVGDVD